MVILRVRLLEDGLALTINWRSHEHVKRSEQ